jgi:hypothetical protein
MMLILHAICTIIIALIMVVCGVRKTTTRDSQSVDGSESDFGRFGESNPRELRAVTGSASTRARSNPRKREDDFRAFCFPKKYVVQKHQLSIGEYMAPANARKRGRSDHPSSILVFHRIGSGKTCLAIQVGLHWMRAGRPLYVMPASLIPGFRSELRGGCAGDTFISAQERAALAAAQPGSPEYDAIIAASNARIDEAFQVYSYNKFQTEYEGISAPVIIVDEVQNVIRAGGAFFESILAWITTNKDAPVVLMTATPIFDSPGELVSIARMLRVDWQPSESPTSELIAARFPKHVSYYTGAPEYTFPEVAMKIKKCKMSKHQARWYTSTVEAEITKFGKLKLKEVSNAFYIGSRQRSNIAYPNGLVGDEGLAQLTPALIRDSLDTYSTKFAHLMKSLRKGKLTFVYTNFTGPAGIAALKKCLDASGWSDFAVHGAGQHRYAVWSGDQTLRDKDIVRQVFNSPRNDDASQIRLVIGSPSIKEGVSLMRVRNVHILEAHWNHSRLEQIFGRAVRYCSHKTLPPEERTVKITIYAATTGDARHSAHDPEHSVDLFMLDVADKKREESVPLLEALQDVAIENN